MTSWPHDLWKSCWKKSSFWITVLFSYSIPLLCRASCLRWKINCLRCRASPLRYLASAPPAHWAISTPSGQNPMKWTKRVTNRNLPFSRIVLQNLTIPKHETFFFRGSSPPSPHPKKKPRSQPKCVAACRVSPCRGHRGHEVKRSFSFLWPQFSLFRRICNPSTQLGRIANH